MEFRKWILLGLVGLSGCASTGPAGQLQDPGYNENLIFPTRPEYAGVQRRDSDWPSTERPDLKYETILSLLFVDYGDRVHRMFRENKDME